MAGMNGSDNPFGSLANNTIDGQVGTNDGKTWVGWQDVVLPGYNVLNNMFDFTGSSAAQAQFNNQWLLNKDAQGFNASEAEKQRAWEQMMSNTQYQRLVTDLKAADLNPYLALGNMGGAGTPSGSSASTSSGSAVMANNKLTAAAGILAVALRMILAKH